MKRLNDVMPKEWDASSLSVPEDALPFAFWEREEYGRPAIGREEREGRKGYYIDYLDKLEYDAMSNGKGLGNAGVAFSEIQKATARFKQAQDSSDSQESTTNFETMESGAQKDIGDKLLMELVPPEAVEAIATGFTYGAGKYAPNNWRKGIPLTTSYAAALRHMLKWAKGVDADDESGLHHLDHAITNLAMMVTQIRKGRKDLDDRYVD